MRALTVILPSLTGLALLTRAPNAAANDDRCRAAPSAATGAAIVRRAIDAVGLDRTAGRVRVSPATDVVSMDFQSDRMYPPYLRRTANLTVATDWERARQRTEQGGGSVAYVSDGARRVFITPRGAQTLTGRTGGTDERAMDPWIVLADWKAASDVRVVGECYYRDYWRTVIARRTADGNEERLYVDTKTGFPVKLDRRERHYLWGDVRAEYLWSIWAPAGGAVAPQFAFRIVDGETNHERQVQQFTLQSRDSAPTLEFPANVAPAASAPPAPVPDTVRVSGNTFMLVTPAYTNVVTLQRDTVFVLDAQTSADRARQDSVWIGKLFPGRHPIVLVVTDLAWPHIAGVRYWVALGTPVISHRLSREFLTRVVEHRWTLDPDLLEQRRARVRLELRAVDDAADLAGGLVRLRVIDGIGSEGALMAYLPNDRFLYPGDYVQPGGPGSFSAMYAREVHAAVERAGFTPERFAAMHMKLSPWSDVQKLVTGGGI